MQQYRNGEWVLGLRLQSGDGQILYAIPPGSTDPKTGSKTLSGDLKLAERFESLRDAMLEVFNSDLGDCWADPTLVKEMTFINLRN